METGQRDSIEAFKIQGGCSKNLGSSCFSLSKGATFLFSLFLSTSQHREFHSGALMQGWRGEWIFPLSSPLSLSTIGEANIFT
jgi:hypothetical protein